MSYTFVFECRECSRNCTVDKVGCMFDPGDDVNEHLPTGCTFGTVRSAEWTYVEHYEDD